MTQQQIEHDTDNQAPHSGRDSYGRSIVAGTYMMTRPGAKPIRVEITEDEISGDLAFPTSVDGSQVMQRVEECACDVTFSKISAAANEADEKLEAIRVILQGADEARRDLAELEQELAALLGCAVADNSPLSDAVCAAVRDGMGTPFDLLAQVA